MGILGSIIIYKAGKRSAEKRRNKQDRHRADTLEEEFLNEHHWDQDVYRDDD